MPSVNWQEAADNWFGGCCCSFGGVSEKLVNRYSMSYDCTEGKCILNSTTVIICKDDLLGFEFPEVQRSQQFENQLILNANSKGFEKVIPDCESDQGRGISCHELQDTTNERTKGHTSTSVFSEASMTRNEEKPVCCLHTTYSCCEKTSVGDFFDYIPENNNTHCNTAKPMELPVNKKHFLNGFLEDVFMTRSYNLSKAIEWVDLACPKCSVLLGAYPSAGGRAPLDDGIRLIKCYISTDLPVGRPTNIFK